MKALILFLMLFTTAPAFAGPWFTKTKHKPINTMTKRQVRNAQKGKTLYVRHPKTGKVMKNNFMVPKSHKQSMALRSAVRDKRNPINYGNH